MPLLQWDDAVRSVIWKQKVALQSDAAISAKSFACLHSPSNVRITRLVMRKLCTTRTEKQTCSSWSLASRRRAEGMNILLVRECDEKDGGLLLLDIQGQRDKHKGEAQVVPGARSPFAPKGQSMVCS